MSFFNSFQNHPIIVGCSIVLASFGTGFGASQYLSDYLHKVESVETGRLSDDVSTLQQQVLSKDESIQTLTSELATARDELIQQRNASGSGNVSLQSLNQKHSSLTQEYNQLVGMYKDLQFINQKAQQNCNALNRIDFLEQKRRNLENALSSVQYDTFEKDPVGKKNELQVLLAQNHEQLLNLQQQLSR